MKPEKIAHDILLQYINNNDAQVGAYLAYKEYNHRTMKDPNEPQTIVGLEKQVKVYGLLRVSRKTISQTAEFNLFQFDKIN